MHEIFKKCFDYRFVVKNVQVITKTPKLQQEIRKNKYLKNPPSLSFETGERGNEILQRQKRGE